jgi:hypothetical protein
MNNSQQYELDNSFTRRTSKALNQFWAGYVIYTTCYTLIISDVVPYKLTYLQLLGIVIFVIPLIHLIRLRIDNTYFKNIYIIYCCWLIFIIIRGFSFDKQSLFDTLTDETAGLFLYFVPLIILFPKDLRYLKKVVAVILILSGFYILYDIFFIKALLAYQSENGQTIIEYFSKNLGIPCGFILLTMIYHTDKKNIWALFVIVLIFLLAVIRARRGLMFMSSTILMSSYLIYIYTHRRNLFAKVFPIIIVFFLSVYAFNVYTDKSPGPFRFITERLKEDTRSEVEEYFYLDLNQKDWIIGKGINGSYYCPTGATPDGYRTGIETDYLNIILKGGIVSLVLLLLITIPAMILGLFYSKNILSKAAAIWIFLWLIELFPAPITTFSLNYLLVWISVGICYSKRVRNTPDDVIKESFI